MKLHVKLLGFSWDQKFKVLDGGPIPVILGLDFMQRTRMSVDVAAKKFQFGFAPHLMGQCGNPEGETGEVCSSRVCCVRFLKWVFRMVFVIE